MAFPPSNYSHLKKELAMAAAASGADVQSELVCPLCEAEVHPVAQPEAWPPGDDLGGKVRFSGGGGGRTGTADDGRLH